MTQMIKQVVVVEEYLEADCPDLDLQFRKYEKRQWVPYHCGRCIDPRGINCIVCGKRFELQPIQTRSKQLKEEAQ